MESLSLVEMVSWSGTLFLVTAGLYIDKVSGKMLQLAGIACLLAQSLYLQELNLVFLNLATMVSFTVSLYRQLFPVSSVSGHGRVYCKREIERFSGWQS
mgnify:CR=1 FL=1|tara:strand:- start:307 stop:603 length:297 start_codon:yes stop_codon:yes gene_type:complete